jgi:hypothetical protein
VTDQDKSFGATRFRKQDTVGITRRHCSGRRTTSMV